MSNRSAVDLLTELLHEAGLRRRLLDLRELQRAVALRFPCDKSIGLHVVTRGRVFLHAEALREPVALGPGDIAVMARGCHHVLAPAADLEGLALRTIGQAPDEAAPIATGSDAVGTVIGGAYQLWNTPVHPLFRELPAWFVLRADSQARLGPLALTIAMLDEEVQRQAFGFDTVVQGLFDVIFVILLREMVEQRGAACAGWSQAVRDQHVRRAVVAMHDDCAHPWTLEELASLAGLSRTGLAQRFRAVMGNTPLAYLRTVRLQRAMRLLSETDRTLEQVAAQVGYRDAFSFSKVFKRVVGIAPKEFRRRDTIDRGAPWRFGGEALRVAESA